MTWYEEALNLSISSVLLRLGATTKHRRWGPCPLCGESKEKSNSRPPINIFQVNGKERFACNACKAYGSHFELVAQYLFQLSSYTLKNQGRFHELRSWYSSADFSHIPKPEYIIEYPPNKEVSAFIDACKPIKKDSKEWNYLVGRGINPSKAPVRMADPDFDIESLSKREWKNQLLPWWPEWNKPYRLIIPLMNHKTEVKSFVGRTIYKKKGKTAVPLRYNTQNLFMMSPGVINWINGGAFAEKIWIAEGEIDFLHLASKGANVIGIRNGTIDHLQRLPWKTIQQCYIATDADEAGDRYAEKIPDLVCPAMSFRVHFNLLGEGK